MSDIPGQTLIDSVDVASIGTAYDKTKGHTLTPATGILPGEAMLRSLILTFEGVSTSTEAEVLVSRDADGDDILFTTPAGAFDTALTASGQRSAVFTVDSKFKLTGPLYVFPKVDGADTPTLSKTELVIE